MRIFVTGGLGFIGSHTVVQLLNAGHAVFILDSLVNSSLDVLDTIRLLAPHHTLLFQKGSISDTSLLLRLLRQFRPDCVMHFAGLKSVKDSIVSPLQYYETNVVGTLSLLEAMQQVGCKTLVFSSSATVYGTQTYPVSESAPTGQGITNPYGRTKYMIEEILKDVAISNSEWCILSLRYFNPVGAHPSGLLGERPVGIPNNLMPYLVQVAQGVRPVLHIYGDGSAVRDFFHVENLAAAHVTSVERIVSRGFQALNVGSGKGTSVTDLIQMFETMNQIQITKQHEKPRDGDLPTVFAQISTRWPQPYTLQDACLHAYLFANRNRTKAHKSS